MRSILHFYFGWYTGAVWSNLVASAICGALVWWRIHVQAAKHHAVAIAQAARHHAERLRVAQEHHEALKAHVTATAMARPQKTLARKPAKEAET